METANLGILKILPTDMFADDTFNAVLDDIDIKVVGVAHLVSGEHWSIRKPDTAYSRRDVVRWPAMKSHQYAECIVAGITSSSDTINNYTTGDIVYDGDVVWRIWSLTEQNDANGGIIKIWLSGYEYKKGDAALYGRSIYRCIIDHTATSFLSDSSKWQEIYASIRPFIVSVYYKTGDTVLQGNLIYKCLTDHVSTNFSADISNWELVGNLALLHEWEVNKIYHQDEIVMHNGQIYRALSEHISTTDLEVDVSNWELVTASIPLWETGTYYIENSIVHHNNILYKCIDDHTSGLTFDTANWQMLHDPNAFIRNWSANTKYYQNQVVKYAGNLYRCIIDNDDSVFTISKWELLTDSINDWVANINYVVGQYVNYNGSIYKCIIANNDATFNSAKWQKMSGGLDSWESNFDYSVGDIVINANKIYQCNTAHTSSSTFTPDANKWTEISACITRIPNWEVDTEYVVGDLVAHDAKIYRCTTAHTSDPTQWDDTEEANWEELSPTINEISNWAVSTDYEIGQLVIHDNKLYRCNTDHTSDSTSFNADIAYWDLIGSSGIEEWRIGEVYQQGSMVVYNDRIYVCDSTHTSANPFDYTKWHEVSSTIIEDWQAGTEYVENQPIEYNDTLFRANKDFTSGTTVSDDDNNLDFVYANLSTWQAGIYYREGSIVIDSDDKIYKCKQSHTSSLANKDTNWEELSKTLVEEYAQNKNYVEGALVIYNGKLYRANTDVTNSAAKLDLNKWDNIVGSGIEQWQPSTDYSVGNVVVNNNQIYICTTAHTSDSIAFNTDIANWGLLDTKWKSENWSANTLYTANEVVLYDNRLFRCVSTHTSAADFATDANYWLAIGSRLEVWKQNVHYKVEDVLINNNKLYRCIIEHTSTSTFDGTKWEEISPTKLDAWQASTDYAIGDYVVNNNKIYKCTTAHTSTSDFDKSKWVEISSYDIDLWQTATDYSIGNLIIHDNKIYRCNTAHTSDTTSFGVDIANWDEIGSSGIDNWEQNKLYSNDNVVIYNNKIYKCIAGHTSSTTFDSTKWVEVSSSDIDAWSVSTDYVVGDFVYKDNQLYRCITAHTSDSSDFDVDIAKWELLDTKWKAENWVASKLYTANEVVLYDNRLFKCVSTHNSAVDFATDGNYWQALSIKLEPWKVSTYYTVGDTVINNNKLYKCIVAHTSDSTSISVDLSNWEIVGSGGIDTWKSNEDYTTSSVVIHNNKIYKCNTAHTSGSTFDPTKWDEISSYDIGLWQASTAYKIGNLVIKDGQIYRCITAHTSATFNNETANWELLDTKWIAKNWSASTLYFANSVIVYNGTIYRANTAHVSGTSFEVDKSKWDILNANIRTWIAGISYKVGDIVLKDKELLRCKVANIDSGFKGQNWELVSKCHVGMWKAGPDPDILALLHFEIASDPGYNEYGASFSNLPNTDGNYFRTTSGGKWGNCGDLTGPKTGQSGGMDSGARIRSPYYSFANGEIYTVEFWMRTRGDPFYEKSFGYIDSLGTIINIGGALFPGTSYQYVTGIDPRRWIHYAFVISPTICRVYMNGKQVHSFTRPNSNSIRLTHWVNTTASAVYGEGWVDEIRITKREVYTTNFTPQTSPFGSPNFDGYEVGDLAVYDDKIYRCITANNDMEFTPSKWVEISKPQIPLWETSTPYVVGDIVIYDNQTYRCITTHTSNTFLGDIDNWNPLDINWLVYDWVASKLYLEHQVVSYDNCLWKCLDTHESDPDDSPTNAKLYKAGTDILYVDDSTGTPYSEIIDIGSVQRVTDFTYTGVVNGMSIVYNAETSVDGVTFSEWEDVLTNARYIKLTVESLTVYPGATSPNAYLSNFVVVGESSRWEKISSSSDIEYATNIDIDNLFI